jgi:hypothetical protein
VSLSADFRSIDPDSELGRALAAALDPSGLRFSQEVGEYLMTKGVQGAVFPSVAGQGAPMSWCSWMRNRFLWPGSATARTSLKLSRISHDAPKDKSFQTSAGADATRKSIMAKSFHLTVSSGKGRTDSHLKVVAATVPV